MLWFERPPLLRWLAAAVLVAVAAWTEFAPPPTAEVAFLAVDVPVGTRILPEHLVYEEAPVGLIPAVEPEGVAAVDLGAGDPLVPSMLSDVAVPEDWLLIEAPVPEHAPPGTPAVAIVLDQDTAPREFPALVVARSGSDAFGASLGTIAVPPDRVGEAAAAVADGRLVVGVGTGSE